MKRLAIAAFAVMALGMGSMPAAAQQFGVSMGDLYLTTDIAVDPWDPELGAPTICIDNPGVPAFSTLNFFLVVSLDFADIGQPGQNVSNGFKGWEAKVNIPPQLTITARVKQPPSSINVGNDATDNWIIGTGLIITAGNTPYAVIEYNSILLAAATDLSLTLQQPTPSSFDVPEGPGPKPGWLEGVATGECKNAQGNPRECLRAFERWNDCENTFVLNYTGAETCALRCAIATKDTSWGALKSNF